VIGNTLNIGIIGLGTVGQGVVKLLQDKADCYAERLGKRIAIRKVLVRNLAAARDVKLPHGVVTTNPDELLGDTAIDVVVEVAGGVKPVGDYLRRALTAGKHVVTANKSLLAADGPELFGLARKHNVSIAFEASCGGGIPILAALKFGLAANRIDAVYGILNGTCNFILTKMSEEKSTYAAALQGAQERGYAEADPTLDVSGADTAQKLVIAASLAFGVAVGEKDVAFKGIDKLQDADMKFGSELGYTIKLLAIGQRHADGLLLCVEPCFVHNDTLLAQVRHGFNTLSVIGDAVGHCMFYGHGAGRLPTASAVVSDILNVASGWYPQAFAAMKMWPDQHPPMKLIHPDEAVSRFYLRLDVKDEPGVLGRVAALLGEHGISIASVLQHEANNGGTVPLIITTHQARAGEVRRAAEQIQGLPAVRTEPVCIRIVDMPQS
jgi:homoserine dehydrogenase